MMEKMIALLCFQRWNSLKLSKVFIGLQLWEKSGSVSKTIWIWIIKPKQRCPTEIHFVSFLFLLFLVESYCLKGGETAMKNNYRVEVIYLFSWKWRNYSSIFIFFRKNDWETKAWWKKIIYILQEGCFVFIFQAKQNTRKLSRVISTCIIKM